MESWIEKPTRVVMLMLTDRCNLRCRYCYEHQRNGKGMDAAQGKQILDQVLGQPSAGEQIWVIEFFGGETLLAMDLLKELYTYSQTKYPNIQKRYAFTTNGTCFTPETKQWFAERAASFRCTISLDGLPEVHNLNRLTAAGKPTWDLIDLDFVRTTFSDTVAKMTVTSETLPMLAESVRFIESLGFHCKLSLASGMEWDSAALAVFYGQLERLAENYIREPDLPLCSLLDLPLENLYDAEEAEDIRFCDAGLYKQCYDMCADVYPCQGLTPLAAGANSISQMQWESRLKTEPSGSCSICPWRSVCATCYAANLLETGSLYHAVHRVCLMHQLCILTASYIQFNRLESKVDAGQLSEQEEKMVYAIQKIQDEIPKVPEIKALLDASE